MNILIIDDYELIAEGVTKRIRNILPEASCYYANNVRSAYAILHQNEIDLIISDLEFEQEPQYDGFYIAEKILELDQRAKIIALTHYNSYRIMKRAKAAGFKSFLNKGCSKEAFSDTILNVLKYGEYESETEKELKRKRINISRSIFNDSLQGIVSLSKRELEILLSMHKTSDRILLSKLLGIKPYTLDSHLKNIYAKLNLNSKKELAIFALDFQNQILKELQRHYQK